jgi:hypothetical protein
MAINSNEPEAYNTAETDFSEKKFQIRHHLDFFKAIFSKNLAKKSIYKNGVFSRSVFLNISNFCHI